MQRWIEVLPYGAMNAWIIWAVHPMKCRIGVSCIGLIAFMYLQSGRPERYRWSIISFYKSLGFSAISMLFAWMVLVLTIHAVRHALNLE